MLWILTITGRLDKKMINRINIGIIILCALHLFILYCEDWTGNLGSRCSSLSPCDHPYYCHQGYCVAETPYPIIYPEPTPNYITLLEELNLPWKTNVLIDGSDSYTVFYYINFSGLLTDAFPMILHLDRGQLSYIKTVLNPCVLTPAKQTSTVNHQGIYTSMDTIGGDFAIAYYDVCDNALKFTLADISDIDYYDSTIVEDQERGYYPDIKVYDDQLYISYFAAEAKDLKLAISNDYGQTWDHTVIEQDGNTGKFSSLEITSSAIFILHYNEDISALQLAVSQDEGGSWEILKIEKTLHPYSSIVNQDNSLWVSYYNSNLQNLWLARVSQLGGSWIIDKEMVDESLGTGYYPSITYENPYIYISYYDEIQKNLKFARKSILENNWLIQAPDFYDEVGLFPSISVHDFRIYISYLSLTNSQLRLIKSLDYGENWNIYYSSY